MTTLSETRPAPAPIPAPARAGKPVRWLGTGLFVIAVGLAGYTGFRLPGTWVATLESTSLTDGFHRRFLVGTLLHPLAVLAGYDYRVFAVASYAVLGGLLAALAIAFFRSPDGSRRLVIIGFLLLPTGGYLFHEVGYYDQTLYLLLVGALAALRRNRPGIASALMVASVTVHEIALLTVLPVFGFQVLRRFPFRRACVFLAAPALAGLTVLAVRPAAPGAVSRLGQTLAGANFPYRTDALGLFERGQAASWALYSITDVLLYLVPIAVVVLGGFLVLHRPSGAALLPLAAIAAPLLLAFGGWDEARWGFLLITNFLVVLWLWLGDRGRELKVSQLGTLSVVLLILTHLPMPYFDHYTPREITLVGPPHAVGFRG
ncbi:hypothetical protein [Amycolatopsis saalfeldensis]|uniref:Uncharacterized protein n=1 Tax=Amycolatopsis saalfeldensis TaxID=394193 RepID=A0A1H8YEE0_9PSEU|nr:hypothetical protein [Amycolatopsis saalfeldensis]SEP50391.1 hypothetical protein SAMN04489732_114121 [Amycolatopsis saalfeldensis]